MPVRVGPAQARRRRRWQLVVVLVTASLLAGGVAVAWALTYLSTAVPLPAGPGEGPAGALDDGHREVVQARADAGREGVGLAELPDHVVTAVLAAEDARFYEHRGISLAGLVRAALANVRAGDVRQGGSTISQQYVKTLTADTDRTLLRKLREAVLAVKLERSHSKDEILERYLNSVYFGRGAYGIDAAARAYYGISADQLDQAQAVQLAGLLPAPSRYDPAVSPAAASARYRYVLERLVQEGWLAPVEAARLAAHPPGG